ncbi:MAG: Ig-like domain-containing protein, partial [Verrucomicrobiales bacterium]|nr:Ig-like domain-containing protein [Verrucomicrobiales bacterium]
FANIAVGDAGSYDVVVSNDYGSATSQPVTLNVRPADTVAPVLRYAAGNRTFDGVRVWFSEPLDPATAQDAANYKLSDGLTVVSATLSAPAGSVGDNIVVLATSAQTPGKTYTVTVGGVKDQAVPANLVAAGSSVGFSSWTLSSGFLAFEHYDGISGAADSDIVKGLADPRVIAGKPTTSGYVQGRFDTRTVFPDDSHEAYLARITGWIIPTESGDYYFFLGSDDAGRLYLSSNETPPNPETDTPICIEEDCCDAFAEPDAGDPATTSSPISLQAGKRYAILALLKEGGGGDHMEVAWRKSTDTTPAASLPRIPGRYLYAYVDPNTDLAIVRQPTNQPASLPTPVVEFTVADFTKNDGGYTVENTNPAPPGPWGHAAASGGWVAQGGETACNGPYNSRLTSPAYVVPETEEVTLTFTHRYSFEGDYWDGGQVRISVNGGEFASVSPEGFTANGYATGKIQGTGILNGQRAFNGDSPGYAAGTTITSSVILGSFKKNDTIAVQFVGAWDECTTANSPGWVVRDVRLAYGKAPRASTFVAEATASRQGTPTSFTYQWQRNDGSGFVDIADATAATYRIFPVAADLAARFRVVASVPGKSLASEEARLVEGGTTPPEIAIARSGANVTVTFGGRLQSATQVAGPYEDVPGATSPYPVPSTSGPRFFRSAR